jgi:hypothetical protein
MVRWGSWFHNRTFRFHRGYANTFGLRILKEDPLKTEREIDLKIIEFAGLELEEIGQKAARMARVRNEIYEDLLPSKKASLGNP